MEDSKQMKSMVEALGHSPEAALVEATFSHIGIAEEVLDGDRSIRLTLMMTTDPLRGFSDGLFRAHCIELKERALAGEDTRPGTYAEVLGALSTASLKSPLTPDGLHLMELCFQKCFPDQKATMYGRESYPGKLDEDLDDARRALREDWRK
jgi:hypothetical protein